jgi:hypothetical protein
MDDEDKTNNSISKKYKILKTVYLDFITLQDQITVKFDDGIVEYDNKNTLWYITPSGEKHETINTVSLIEKYINDGRLAEIVAGQINNSISLNSARDENTHE